MYVQSNPLHEEQLEIVAMLGGAYAINTVRAHVRACVRVC